MKSAFVLTTVIVCAGCTSLRTMLGNSNELQQRIASGELLKTGDRVLIVTADNQTHRFAITHIDPGRIVGRRQRVRSIKWSPSKSVSSAEPKPRRWSLE